LYGLRAWCDTDLDRLDSDDLETMVQTAKAVAVERSKKK
jgi:hypothetical protein